MEVIAVIGLGLDDDLTVVMKKKLVVVMVVVVAVARVRVVVKWRVPRMIDVSQSMSVLGLSSWEVVMIGGIREREERLEGEWVCGG